MMTPAVAKASWTAPALWRFDRSALLELRARSGRGLPHSKTWRRTGRFSCKPLVGIFIFLFALSLNAAGLPADWQHEQPFNVPAPGLVKLGLPVETLDAARPALEDLRLYDDAGNEVPYLIERPVPVVKVVQNVQSFHVSLTPSNTVIVVETGLTQPLDDIVLETPAGNFIKPVRVEGSTDLKRWQTSSTRDSRFSGNRTGRAGSMSPFPPARGRGCD